MIGALTMSTLTRTQLTATANAVQALDFDTVFRIDPTTGDVAVLSPAERTHAGEWAPEVWHDDTDDVVIEGHGEWHALTGLTGQYGYSGAVMHESEVMSGSWGVVEEMLRVQDDEPTVWAQVVVGVMPEDDEEEDTEPAGWAIVYRRA